MKTEHRLVVGRKPCLRSVGRGERKVRPIADRKRAVRSKYPKRWASAYGSSDGHSISSEILMRSDGDGIIHFATFFINPTKRVGIVDVTHASFPIRQFQRFLVEPELIKGREKMQQDLTRQLDEAKRALERSSSPFVES